MKRYTIFMLLLLLLFSCKTEDELTPSTDEKNYFAVDANAKDEVSLLRKEFHSKNGTHLLFNDTLRNEIIGKDPNGKDIRFVETIDFRYQMTSTAYDIYLFTYLQNTDIKKRGIEKVEQVIFPHLGARLKPYSILLVETIGVYYESYSAPKYVLDYYLQTLNGMRCLAIAMDGLEDMNDDDFKLEIFLPLLTARLEAVEQMDEFYAFCNRIYGEYKDNRVWDDHDAFSKGFCKDSHRTYYPYKKTDLQCYLNEVLTSDNDEFNQRFENYPIVLKKYALLRNILLELGYIF